MDLFLWFDSLPTLGKLAPEQAATRLYELGEVAASEVLESAEKEMPQIYGAWALLCNKPWQHTPTRWVILLLLLATVVICRSSQPAISHLISL